MDAPWLVVANYLKGVSEYSGALTNPKIEEMFSLSGSPWVHSDETPWCAAFVGACLRLSGFRSSNNLGARSYLNYGAPLEEPVPGCIVVFWRGDPNDTSRGHVAFLDHVDDKYVYALGGNQGNMVQVRPYDRNRVLAFRQPTEVAPIAHSKVLRNFNDLTGGPDGQGDTRPAEAAVPAAAQPPAAPAPVAPAADHEEPVRIGVPEPVAAGGGGAAARPSNFGKVQPIVDKWEGGYVDDPKDPGGATNMGVTIYTLAAWCGHKVSKADVKALTRGEVWQIMKSRYYDVVRGDDLPIGVATGVHNAAVLSGPKRAATWLQQSMQALGSRVTVDGAIGDETIGFVEQLDPTALMEQFFRRQESFYRSLSTFPHFGKGWMNRLNDVRLFARKLQSASMPGFASFAGVPDDSVRPVDVGGAEPGPFSPAELDNPDTLKKIIDVLNSQRQQGTLTPVNAALGDTIGSMLNGNKTLIGTLGVLFSTLVNQMSHSNSSTVALLQDNVTPFLKPVAITVVLWGLLGKYEKWVYGDRKRK